MVRLIAILFVLCLTLRSTLPFTQTVLSGVQLHKSNRRNDQLSKHSWIPIPTVRIAERNWMTTNLILHQSLQHETSTTTKVKATTTIMEEDDLRNNLKSFRIHSFSLQFLCALTLFLSPLVSLPITTYGSEYNEKVIQTSTTTTMMIAATPTTTIDPFIYTNEYSDPLHPLCKRRIEVNTDGKTFHYSGTAVGPKGDPVLRGCTPPEIKQYKLRTGAFDGFVLENGAISAGDGIHEGVWEPAGTTSTESTTSSSTMQYTDVDGIRWNDGNKWMVVQPQPKTLTTRIGEGIFYSYIGFSTLAGAKGLYDGIQRKRREAEEQLV